MPRFNFNEITKSGKADIDLIGKNFEEIEENGITEAEVEAKIDAKIEEASTLKYQKFYDSSENRGVSCRIFRQGKIVFCDMSWSISGGRGRYKPTSFTINLPEWAIPSNIYSSNSLYDYRFISALNGGYITDFSATFDNNYTTLQLDYTQREADNTYSYTHHAIVAYIAAN